MPRLAPVRSSVRRGPLLDEVGITVSRFRLMPGLVPGTDVLPCSGIEPRLRPGSTRAVAAEFDTIVQAERAVVPELELQRRDAPAAPARRARHLANNMFGGELGDRLFKGKTAFQRLRLLAGPSADLGLFRPGGEVSGGLGTGHRGHRATDAHLPAQRLPVKK